MRLRLIFFRKWIVLLPRAQAGFDVPNRDMVVVRSERGGKGCGRISLDKHQGRAFLAQDPIESRQAGRRHSSKVLSCLHHS